MKVRETRIKKGISQLELARRARISPADLNRIEQGKIPLYPGWKKRIAKSLGVATRDLEEVE